MAYQKPYYTMAATPYGVLDLVRRDGAISPSADWTNRPLTLDDEVSLHNRKRREQAPPKPVKPTWREAAWQRGNSLRQTMRGNAEELAKAAQRAEEMAGQEYMAARMRLAAESLRSREQLLEQSMKVYFGDWDWEKRKP